MKNQKAITLIALIITIIVLLILAGVTINMVLGENGLFNKAKTSVAKYENAQEEENTALKDYETEIDNASRDTVTISKEEYEMLKNENTYTDKEKRIGTWIDGKPLYTKTLKLDEFYLGNPYEWISINHNIADVDNIYIDQSASYVTVRSESSTTGDNYAASYCLDYANGSNDSLVAIKVNKTQFSIYKGRVGAHYYAKPVVTVKYTKTTDPLPTS